VIPGTNSTTGADGRKGSRRAFTLVELLLVIIIIGVLAAITIPSIHKAQLNAMRSASLMVVNQIDSACQSYATDFNGAYPPSVSGDYPNWFGGQLLPLFLTGYAGDGGSDGAPSGTLYNDDGAEGFGFRTVKRGPVRGPYRGTEALKTAKFPDGTDTDPPSYVMFIDAFEYPILYYRYDQANSTYQRDHNYKNLSSPDRRYGPTDVANYAKAGTGKFLRKDFLLISKGPDGTWGAASAEVLRSDDITNFLQEY